MPHDDIVNSAHGSGDADDPRIGTSHGPGVRPGARKRGGKPGQNRGELVKWSEEEKLLHRRKRIQKEVVKHDFERRTVELARTGKNYVESAEIMSVEWGEPISAQRVRRAYLNTIRNVEALNDMRAIEYDTLSSQAAKMRVQLDEMDARGTLANADLEVYAKVADTYLKFRERIAKLLGLDAATKTIMSRGDGGAPGQPLDGGSVHIGADGITVRMPGSVNAYEDWLALDEKGLIDVAGQVIELEAAHHEEVDLGNIDAMTHRGEKAGLTLAPDADVTPKAERVKSALEALALLRASEDAGTS